MSRRKRKADNARHVEELSRHLARRGPGDEWHAPTPERIDRSKDAGQKIIANIILTEAGNPTGHFNWQISGIIDELERRGTLDREDWAVAMRYMRHYVGSHGKGPATAKFLPYYDRGFQALEPAERTVAFGQAVRLARRAVHPIFHPGLDWLEKACEDEWPLWRLGEKYYPHLTKPQQSAKAPTILHFTIGMLAAHYEMGHRWSSSDIETVVRKMKIERMTIEVDEVIHRNRA